MTVWRATDDANRSNDECWPRARWCRECVAIDRELVCIGTLAGNCPGGGCCALSKDGAQNDGGDSVRDLDGRVCRAGGVAAGACVWGATRWRAGGACGRGACRCSLEFCDSGSVADCLLSSGDEAGDERGAI